MKDEATFAEHERVGVALTIFAAWSCFFSLILVPLELLFRLDAVMGYLTPLEIFLNSALVVILYSVVAAVFAIVSLALKLFIQLFRVGHIAAGRIVVRVNLAIILWAAVYKLALNCAVWLRAVLHANQSVSFPSMWFVAAASVIVGALLVKDPQLIALSSKRAGNILLAAAIFTSAAVLAVALNIATALVANRAGLTESRTIATDIGNARPNVILITLDALTAEDMSLYGYRLPTTPRIAAFANECYVFKNNYANSTFTTPGIVSILTAKTPSSSKIYGYYQFLSGNQRTENIAHQLKGLGYSTAALFANSAGHPDHNGTFRDFDYAPAIDHLHNRTPEAYCNTLMLSLERVGFHPYIWFGERLLPIALRLDAAINVFRPDTVPPRDAIFKRPASVTLQLARDYLRTAKGPTFLWVHLLAPHAPYLPTPDFRYKFLPDRILDTASSQRPYENLFYGPALQPLIDQLRLRYDEHLASVDNELGKFLDDLVTNGYAKNSLIIITSDHGEEFVKGYHEHGGTGCKHLYQPLIHIPLLVHLPGQLDARVISVNTEQIDIAPTILAYLGHATPRWMDGESLLPAMSGDPFNERPIYSMNLELCNPRKPIDDGSVAVIKNKYKYIYYVKTQEEQLYDLRKDPGESHDLSSLEPALRISLRGLALKRLGLD